MHQIENTARECVNEGVTSIERIMERSKAVESRNHARSILIEVLQLKGRALSLIERDYIDKWIEMGYTAVTVELAYRKTVQKTGKLMWAYLDTLLKS